MECSQKFCEFCLGSSDSFPTLYTIKRHRGVVMSGFSSDVTSTNSPFLPISPSVSWFDYEKSHAGLGVLMVHGFFFFSHLHSLKNVYVAWHLAGFWLLVFSPKMVLVRMGFFFHT